MQAHIHKKEKSPTIKCPKCGASNLTSQKSCGKCGFRFEGKGGEANKGKMAFEGVSGARGVGGADSGGGGSDGWGKGGGFSGGKGGDFSGRQGGTGEGFSGVGTAEGNNDSLAQGGEGVDDDAGKEEKPKVPDKFAKNGQSEGLLKSRKQWVQCPVCNSDIRPDAKRCPRCGHKNY